MTIKRLEPMNTTAKVLLIIFAFVLSVGTAIYVSREWGFSEGYKHGHDVGWQDAKISYNVDNPPKTYLFEYQELTTKYDNLVKDYNNLAAYANAPRKQTLNCTTNTLGSYAYTNCF